MARPQDGARHWGANERCDRDEEEADAGANAVWDAQESQGLAETC